MSTWGSFVLLVLLMILKNCGWQRSLPRGVNCTALRSPRFSCSTFRSPHCNGSITPPPAIRKVEWQDILLIVVTTRGREEFLQAAGRTWVSRLPKDAEILLAMGTDSDTFLFPLLSNRENVYKYVSKLPDNYKLLDRRMQLTLTLVEHQFADKKYFVKVDDDSLLVPGALVRFINEIDSLDTQAPLYFGKANCSNRAWGGSFCFAPGAAYGLNLPALRAVVHRLEKGCSYFEHVFQEESMSPSTDKSIRAEDVMVATCLYEEVEASVIGCDSFFPQNPIQYYAFDGDQIRKRFEGSEIISFHHLAPSALLALDKFLYNNTQDVEIRGDLSFSKSDSRMKDLLETCSKPTRVMECNKP